MIAEAGDFSFIVGDGLAFLLGNFQHACRQSRQAGQLYDITAIFFCQRFHDLVAVESLIEPSQALLGGIHSQGFLDERDGIGRIARIAEVALRASPVFPS